MRCPVCQQPLEANDKWNIHYIRPRSEGGTDNLANMIMVHPDCHRQIHSQHLHVVKPVSIEA
ncbi:HNH endonuclease signature motif containing protein [Methylobacter sp.]